MLVQETFVCVFMLGGLMLVHKLVICTIICIFSERPNPEIRVICKLLSVFTGDVLLEELQ